MIVTLATFCVRCRMQLACVVDVGLTFVIALGPATLLYFVIVERYFSDSNHSADSAVSQSEYRGARACKYLPAVPVVQGKK